MAANRPGSTLSQIATSLGVSSATVSNALSGKGRVSAELADRIRAKAAEIGYTPSLAGRALRTGRTQVLGLVLPDIANPLFPQIAQAIENAASEAGYGVLIADSRGETARQTEAINRLLERDVDGIVVVPRLGTRIADLGCPVAVIDSPSTPGNTVSADHWQGGQLVAEHLAGLGHRDIVLIGTNARSNVQNDRIGGMKSGLSRQVRVEVLWVETIERQAGQGCPLGLEALVDRGFTAFAAVSDLQALRALTELQRAGIRVPEDVSVTGFDDLVWSTAVTPSLTTVRQDLATIAELAVQALADMIAETAPQQIPPTGRAVAVAGAGRVPMTLIARQTSAAVAASSSRRQPSERNAP
ncbi:LacI family DNA-binding transcriptional regulator [Rhizobium halophytocola]|uniref:LacI family transcriptional regulator n=1 Tax=Rhizobium halophytocola TaxID=735519 RepID=A0ABS4DTX5_9HYPH|nr:LacI family DNA-binding transcriptional regulator [Rhizobium halophytocola]MBP1849136.1 LacI family transcriptional regulator [Rhizobium halophytocola]